MVPKRMLKPWANMRVSPAFRWGRISSRYSFAWPVSGVRTITMSAPWAASATSRTVSPSAWAFARERLLPGRPTSTSTPLSRRFSAWAWPWLP